MAKKTDIIHLGISIEELKEKLLPVFNYLEIDHGSQFLTIDNEDIVINNRLNPQFRDALFLITQAKFLEPKLLKNLPANSIIIDQALPLNDEVIEALNLKNPQLVEFKGIDELADQLKKTFFGGQLGYKLNYDKIQFDPSFLGRVSQRGHNQIEITDHHYDEYRPILKWRTALPIAPETCWDISFEHLRMNKTTDLRLRVMLVDPQHEKMYFMRDIENDELKQRITIEVAPQGGFLIAELFAKGDNIYFKVGQLHVRKSRDGRGELLIGENKIVDETQLNSELLYYFDPGDFKPPLNVYFSGFRLAEGVEGVFMMRDLKAPALIFADPRLLGGAFYMGSEKFERAIVETIQAALQKLNFKSNDLILSGLSMGTYAALYYSSFLNPAWVMIGKPLTNLGDIAANERINRPNGFPTALDVLLKLAHDVDEDAIQRANKLFWESFARYDHAKINFVIAYMENDDYDQNAFLNLTDYLHQYASNAKIIHKGLVGRHNDATNELGKWFIQQYRNVLKNNYGKQFDD